jgi:hypothetical protein
MRRFSHCVSLVSRASAASALARAERDPGPSAKSAKRVTCAGCDSSCRPGSRVSLRSPGTRACEVAARKANRWPPSVLTMSNSAVLFVRRRTFLRSRAPSVRRGSSPSFASIPRMRGWRSADRRTLLLCRACEARRPRERNAGRPVATGTPSRRSVVAVFGRGPVLPPPAVAPEPMSTCPRQTLRPDGRGPGPPALRFAPQSRDATPRSIVRIVSGGRPLRARMANLYYSFVP